MESDLVILGNNVGTHFHLDVIIIIWMTDWLAGWVSEWLSERCFLSLSIF